MRINKCKRGCILACKGKLPCCPGPETIEHKYLGGKWPTIAVADDPSLILWKNLGVDKCRRVLRSMLVNIVCLIVVLGGFYLVVWVMRKKDEQVK